MKKLYHLGQSVPCYAVNGHHPLFLIVLRLLSKPARGHRWNPHPYLRDCLASDYFKLQLPLKQAYPGFNLEPESRQQYVIAWPITVLEIQGAQICEYHLILKIPQADTSFINVRLNW